MKRALVILVLGLLPVGALAQDPKPTPQASPEKSSAVPKSAADIGQPVNIRIELTITDQRGAAAPAKRTVSMIVADRHAGSVRSSGNVFLEGKGRYDATLNVDAEPEILENGRIRLRVTLEYSPKPDTDNAASGEGRARLSERLSVIVEPGKPLMISQASDPTSDRKIAVELSTAILK